jgi:DUF218 domain
MSGGISKSRWRFAAALAALLLAGFAAKAGSFLVVDDPQRSDIILVLAGETEKRPERALQLLAQGLGRRVILDVPTNAKLFDVTEIDLVERYVKSLPQGDATSVCPIDGLSTRDESKDAERCLQHEGLAPGKAVLLVTSDFHTRRALSVFRRELPRYEFSIAAAHNEQAFGVRWWSHREWAKTCLDEWLRLLWWEVIDRWR